MAAKLDIGLAEKILELPDYYTIQDVDLAYRTRCKEMHPDARQGVSADEANADMARITSSYSMLRKQFRGEAKDARIKRSDIPFTQRPSTTTAESPSPQSFFSNDVQNTEFDPFGEYNDYIDINEWFADVGNAERPSYPGAMPTPNPSRYEEYMGQVHEWNTKLQENAVSHQSHVDPHTIDRSRKAHSHNESSKPKTVLFSSCDGPGWWRDLAWFLPEDPMWYQDAMRLAHWLPWALIIYIVAIAAYPLPILNQYGEMLLRGETGSFIWWYSLFLMVYPFVGWLARHPIHDFAERIFAFPFRIACRIYMKYRRERYSRGKHN